MDNNSNMLQLCRLCLVKDDVNIPIFEEQGDIRQIFLKISSCLPVKVSRDDQLPKKICDGCSYKLDMLYEFWNTSANAEKQLLTWLGEAGMTSQMTDGTISAVAQQIKPADAFVKQETIDPPDIHMDDDEEEDKDYMKVEEVNNVEEPPPKRARRTAAVKAAIAIDQNSDDDDDSGEPMTKVEDDSEDSDNEDHEPAFVDVPSTSADDQPGPSGVSKDGVEAPKPKRKKGKSYFADKEIDNIESYVVKPAKLDIPLKCRSCSKLFTNNVDYAIHTRTHSLAKMYHCHICDFKDKSKVKLELHVRDHEGIKKYKCPICDRQFVRLVVAYEHQFLHNGQTPFRCDICGKGFPHSGSVVSHKRKYHHEFPDGSPPEILKFKCKTCNIFFDSNVELKKHKFNSHNQHHYSVLCEFCGEKSFGSRSDMIRHMRTHTGDRPYPCKYCSKTFATTSTRNIHERVHTGEKRYTCSYCGKKFAHDSAHRYHMKIHTGEKKKCCTICEKKYISTGNLKIHMRTCHGSINVNSVSSS